MTLWFVSPHQDEILSSWLIRTAISHGCTPLTLTHTIWGNSWRPWTIDLDFNIPHHKLVPLLSSTLSTRQLQKLTLQDINQKININNDQTRKWITKLGIRNLDRTGGLRFCPLCLSEHGYIKKLWRVAWNIYCEDHNVLLQSCCEKCSLAFSPHKISFNSLDMACCPRCENKLSAQIYKVQDSEIKEIQLELNRMLLQDANKCFTEKFQELLEIYGFFIRFVNSSSLIRSTADQRLIRDIGLNLNKKTGIREEIEKMSAEWLYELFKILVIVRDKSIEDLSEYFNALGYTQQSFTSRLPNPRLAFLQNFISLLPSQPRAPKNITKARFVEAVYPLPREEVLKRWEHLMMRVK
ncbi:TniQ family protein [Wohlfahrtiimonas chitiniclastica]|uniref:TniQ family protein n=1 Tax=Wohlfahrtiimonas chitiniclastica TaxID=400946 RepID=UPI001BCEB9C5|nr:TniQ family protein [Wohlfahrtiimonas chitiniclastica]MBS7820740.1 TniQ family protein [Wohlfahrtiimonas chitiniclastica]